MEKSEKVGEIFKLIPKIMEAVGAIGKTRENDQQHYKFRGIDDVTAALHPVLTKHGVFYVPTVLEKSVDERQTKNGGLLIYTTVLMEFTFHAPDGSSITVGPMVGEGMDTSDKSANKAQSGALKNAILQFLCIPTIEPKDSESDHNEPRAQQPRQPAKPAETVNKQTGEVTTASDLPDYSDLGAFRKATLDAFRARKFNATQTKNAIGRILSGKKIDELAKVPLPDRSKMVGWIRSGGADALKNGQAAKQNA